MLVLARKVDESILIGGDIIVTVASIRGDKVRLGIDAPSRVSVHRIEVHERIQRERSPRPKPPCPYQQMADAIAAGRTL